MPNVARIERELRRSLADSAGGHAHVAARPMMWACVGIVVLFIAWSAWATVDEVARGEGRVVPSSRVQVIQSLEGGILKEMMVKQGDIVEAGQPLVQLDNNRFRSSALESGAQVTALTAAIARLEAEVLGRTDIQFPASIPPGDPVIASERSLFVARRHNLNATVKALADESAYAQRQLAMVQPLAARGVVSEVEALRLGKDIAALSGRQSEVRNTYMQEAYTELAAKKAELAAQTQIFNQRQDQLNRTLLTAPVRSRVNEVLITTRGGVVQPGEAIMQLTPIDDSLLVEARILPRDVAFIRPGMPARVKLTAYDYTVYGDLAATVEQISEDTIEEDTPRGKVSYYVVMVKTDRAFLRRGQQTLPIRPGMVAEVDVLSGNRSVLSYLLKPLLKAKLA